MAVIMFLILLTVVLLAVILNMDSRQVDRLHPTQKEVTGWNGSTSDSVSSTITTTSPRTPSTTPKPEPAVCTTTGCVRAANNIINALNTSVNPCEDFYEFACGSWNEEHPIPDDMSAFGTFSFVREQVRQQLRVLLEQEVTSQSTSINMARIAYKTCMNKTQLEELGTSLLFETLSDLGYWPLLQSTWQREKFDLTDLMGIARRDYGAESFFQIYIYADAKNTSRNTLFVDQTSLSLGRGARDYYLNTTMFANHMIAYRKYFHEIVKILQEDANIDPNNSTAEASIDAVIAFEKKLAEIVVPEDERRNSTRLYNKRVIGDLYEYMDDVDWVAYFRRVAPAEMVDMFNNDTEIIVAEIDFLRKTSALIKETDTEILVNYIVWRVVQASVRLLDERFENIKQVLPLAAGAVYVQAHFNSEDKREALEMIEKLREAFSDLVTHNDWMDESTKNTAIEKANSMINNIGYPNITNDIAKLDEQYKELVILPTDTYYSLMKKAVVWMQKKEFRKLLKPFDRHEFDVSPAVVNAFYSPEKNAISSQYDKDGNLHNWWSGRSLEAFDERRRCIVEQYGNYTVPKTTYKVNGKLTQGENIADNGGVKEALKFWCGQKKEAAAMQQVTTDEHSPEVFRVTGVLSNLQEFADAFSCPPGSALNPKHRCVVW
ncbi:unnamed protein product [Nippostrongylus brasiliensis]|uniref:Neprilysin-2 (inferred by orthology to a C. elegans protein) n=1 Tax=Nippostrongylus brasiliensis TaxID=27835 RepID=A0A158QZK6_NIPBR|nr:unnamed protein product [Nippostrongylus brasiliensis]